MPRPARWDVFCKVVDNYGDAGVCWRLARQLAGEHGLAVTLWLDDTVTLARIAPGIDVGRDDQRHLGVRVRRLDPGRPRTDDLPDVVVDAFGGGLPELYMAAMATRSPPPQWIVLEYLSAEPWVEGAHGLGSPHPRLPLARRFVFPGFTAATGGLPRERGLLAARAAFRADTAAQAAAWCDAGLAPPGPGTLAVSLFCYPDAPLAPLLDAWADGDAPVRCVVPEGVALPALDRFAGGRVPHAGQTLRRGGLELAVVGWVGQDAFDRRLWLCDFNVVRGEDSFVRAQWAARPFAWHLYPQEGNAHRVKLEAFLARYQEGLADAAAAALGAFSHALNDAEGPALAAAWPALRAALPTLEAHAQRWADRLAPLPDLAARLVACAAGR